MEPWFSLRSLTLALLITLIPAWALACAEHENKLPDDSLYQASSKWIDDSGSLKALKDLGGSPLVVAMIYPRCKYTCPLIIAKLKKIEHALASKPAVKFVLVSFDAKNDTPASFRKFMEEKQLDPSRWKLLSGKSSGGIRELATLLDTSYKLEKNGEYSHSNVITLLDRQGVKRASINGLNADHSGFLKIAQELP